MLYLSFEKNENKQKEAGFGLLFKFYRRCVDLENNYFIYTSVDSENWSLLHHSPQKFSNVVNVIVKMDSN